MGDWVSNQAGYNHLEQDKKEELISYEIEDPDSEPDTTVAEENESGGSDKEGKSVLDIETKDSDSECEELFPRSTRSKTRPRRYLHLLNSANESEASQMFDDLLSKPTHLKTLEHTQKACDRKKNIDVFGCIATSEPLYLTHKQYCPSKSLSKKKGGLSLLINKIRLDMQECATQLRLAQQSSVLYTPWSEPATAHAVSSIEVPRHTYSLRERSSKSSNTDSTGGSPGTKRKVPHSEDSVDAGEQSDDGVMEATGAKHSRMSLPREADTTTADQLWEQLVAREPTQSDVDMKLVGEEGKSVSAGPRRRRRRRAKKGKADGDVTVVFDAAQDVREEELEGVPCPLCKEVFPAKDIEAHASECGLEIEETN